MIDFNQVKGAVLGLSEAQWRELVKIRAAMESQIRSTNTGGQQGYARDPTEGLYFDLRHALNRRCDANLPDLSKFKRDRPAIVGKIAQVNHTLEEMLMREFSPLTRQEHDSIKALMVDLAVSYVFTKNANNPENFSPPSPQQVLDALAVPTEMLDDQLPGYRRKGVLRRVLLDTIRLPQERRKL